MAKILQNLQALPEELQKNIISYMIRPDYINELKNYKTEYDEQSDDDESDFEDNFQDFIFNQFQMMKKQKLWHFLFRLDFGNLII